MNATATTNERAADRVSRLAQSHVGPDEISAAILNEVRHDPAAMQELLAEVLPCYVRTRLGAARREPVTYEELVGDPTPLPKFPSKKTQRIRDAYAKLLATQYGTDHGYQTLGQCTADDLEFAAETRRKQAAGHLVEAERLLKLAAAAREYGATTVAELPREVVSEIMQRGGAAA